MTMASGYRQSTCVTKGVSCYKTRPNESRTNESIRTMACCGEPAIPVEETFGMYEKEGDCVKFKLQKGCGKNDVRHKARNRTLPRVVTMQDPSCLIF